HRGRIDFVSGVPDLLALGVNRRHPRVTDHRLVNFAGHTTNDFGGAIRVDVLPAWAHFNRCGPVELHLGHAAGVEALDGLNGRAFVNHDVVDVLAFRTVHRLVDDVLVYDQAQRAN